MNPQGPAIPKHGTMLPARDDPLGACPQKQQRLWLAPEEAIYLLERGSLDVRWPKEDFDDDDVPEDSVSKAAESTTNDDVEHDGNDDNASHFGLPMSLQAAYAVFISEHSLTLEKYTVYANLKRSGFTVFRAPNWDIYPCRSNAGNGKVTQTPRSWRLGLWDASSLFTKFFSTFDGMISKAQAANGPIISPGLYRNYASVYKRLALIGYYDTAKSSSVSTDEIASIHPDFQVTWHVWRSSTRTFKKSDPGEPDFRVAVINARETSVPSLEQLAALMANVPADPPRPNAQMYAKLKWGERSVVLAIVDQGVASYLRVADAIFGREKLYERENRGPGAKKRGGGYAARGRGRGRGGKS